MNCNSKIAKIHVMCIFAIFFVYTIYNRLRSINNISYKIAIFSKNMCLYICKGNFKDVIDKLVYIKRRI